MGKLPAQPRSWGWVFGGQGRLWFEYHPHPVVEVRGRVHVVQNGATLCGMAAQPEGRPLIFCTCETCGWAVAQRTGAYRMPRRVASHVQRAWNEMYVWPEQRAAIREMDRLAAR